MLHNKIKSLIKVLSLLIIVPIIAIGTETTETVDLQIVIDVSPSVLNIQSNGTVVTVHTDIGYSEVSFSSVYLNGILIQSWKADDRGFFVAKFNMDEVKGLPLIYGEYNTLLLVGTTRSGEDFSGAQDILVINNLPKK